MKQLIKSLIIFNFALVSCMSVPRPDAYLCGVNAKSSSLRCYNLKKDFDQDGNLSLNAQPSIVAIKNLDDLNAGIFTSAKDFAAIKAYVNTLKEYYNKNCKVGP